MLNSSLQERKHETLPDQTHKLHYLLLHAAIRKKKNFTHPLFNPVMTSFLNLPLRIFDMPRGIMGRVSESHLVTTDLGG